MDLKQLEYFVRVAELGSFTRASIALDTAQPALSRQVRLLETEFGQHLFIRTGRGVTTTEAGKLLLEHGRGILHQVERAREDLMRARGALAGRVALGLPPSLSRVLTCPLTREIRARLPEASLSISEALSVTMQDFLIAGQLDMALLYNVVPTPDIETTPILEEDLFLVKSSAAGDTPTPVTLAQVAEIPLVIPNRPHAIRMLVETELSGIGKRPRIALEIDSVAAILDLVADGAGCAVLSMNAVTKLGKASALVAHPIVEPRLRSRLCLAASARRPATPTQKTMQEVIHHTATDLLGGHRRTP